MPGSEPRVKILRVIARLNMGGPALHVAYLTAGLRERGYDTTLVAGSLARGEDSMAFVADKRGVEVIQIDELGREISPLRDLRATFRLARLIRRERPQILHTHTAKAGTVGRVAALLAGSRRPPIVVHTFHGHVLRGYFGPLRSLFFRLLERWLAARTTALVAVSPQVRDDLVALGVAPRERFVISPPGIDLAPLLALAPPDPDGHTSAEGEAFRAELGIPRDAPLVLVLGRLAPIKRAELALEVFQRTLQMDRASREARTAHMVLVGDGAIRSLVERQARRLAADVRSRVHFAGAREDVVPALAAADVLLSTSRNEGLPVAMIEAAAAARPVVSTAVGGVAEVVTNGVTGLLAVEEDGLAMALASLLADPVERRRMGLAARAAVQRRHGAEALADRLEALYGRLVRPREEG